MLLDFPSRPSCDDPVFTTSQASPRAKGWKKQRGSFARKLGGDQSTRVHTFPRGPGRPKEANHRVIVLHEAGANKERETRFSLSGGELQVPPPMQGPAPPYATHARQFPLNGA